MFLSLKSGVHNKNRIIHNDSTLKKGFYKKTCVIYLLIIIINKTITLALLPKENMENIRKD